MWRGNVCGRGDKNFGVMNESESRYVFILDIDSGGKNFKDSGGARKFEDFMNRCIRRLVGD
jgi:hypothetical protein